MRIAVFQNLPTGGALRTLYEQLKYLKKNNHTIDLYEINTEKLYLNIYKFVNERYSYQFNISSSLPKYLNRIQRDFNNFVSLNYLHKKIANDINSRLYDVVLVHPDKYTEAPFLLKYLEVPNIYHCHELLRIAYEKILELDKNEALQNIIYEYLTRNIRRNIDKNNACKASQIITSSSYIANKVIETYGRKAKVCYLGVDNNTFKPVANKKIDQVLFIGGKSKFKGYDLAVDSVNMIDEKIRPRLLVLGYGRGDNFVSNENKLAKIYSESLVTICTAYSEPFGLVALESMACGTPVLAVNEGGYKETVINNETGYLLERDPAEFANKIVFLQKNRDKVKELGEQARKITTQRFTWENHGNLLENIMIKLVKYSHNNI